MAASNSSVEEVVSRTGEEEHLWTRGYVLGKMLGEGSYAKVYLADFKARRDGRGQPVACKVINGAQAPRDFIKKFFPREIEVMSRVNHPNLVRIHSILQHFEKYFLFMQFCDNGDLLDFIRKNGAIDEKQSKLWYSQLVGAVKYLHDRDIVHRDLKCENVLLTSTYNTRLSDFGFARYWDVDRHTKSETFCGSVSYAAPEILRGLSYNPLLSDIWSLGVILFIMLNKGMPFDDSNLRKLYDAQVARQWKFRSKVKDRLSNEVKVMMQKLLEPLPEKRVPLEKAMDDPWFDGFDPNDRVNLLGNPKGPRASVFLPSPSHHAYTTDKGVTILDAETQEIRYSRQVFPIADGPVRTSIKEEEPRRTSEARVPIPETDDPDDYLPGSTWSKTRNINDPDLTEE